VSEPARYINPRSGATWPVDTALWRAPDDGDYVNLTPGPGLTPAAIDRETPSMWRYGAAVRLPASPDVTLGEGWTPLLPTPWGDMPVMLKAEYLMPSGSFKDRGTVVMLNYLKQVGVIDILEDSSGNAGASVAAYAAAAGMRCRIMVPASAPAAKMVQMAAMGAEVVAIEGSREDVARAALDAAETAFYASHNRQPFFLEGTKTLAFEIWEQLGARPPDSVVVPLGQGSNVMGCHIGFAELRAAGAIERLPRIYAVQAANCAPYHAAFGAGGTARVDIEPRPTIADGIASSNPVRLSEVMAALHETGGATVAVSEEEIVAALGRLARLGHFVEPTAAATGAGLERLIGDGRFAPGETVVAVLTGTGLKAVEKIGTALGLGGG
jgi:threonine synthase